MGKSAAKGSFFCRDAVPAGKVMGMGMRLQVLRYSEIGVGVVL